MALEGSLRDFDLFSLFNMIKTQGKSGTLVLSRAQEFVKVYFEQGEIVGCESNQVRLEDRIGAMLVRMGRLTGAELLTMVQKQRHSMQRMGQLLLESGYISEQDLKEALFNQAMSILYRVFRWLEGDYRFDSTLPPVSERESFPPIPIDTVLMEAARIIDEWPEVQRRLPDHQTILRPTLKEAYNGPEAEPITGIANASRPVSLTPEQQTILSYFDEPQHIQGALLITRYDELETCRHIANLLEMGLLEASKTPPPISTKATSRRKPQEEAKAHPLTLPNPSPALWPLVILAVVIPLLTYVSHTRHSFNQSLASLGNMDIKPITDPVTRKKLEDALSMAFPDGGWSDLAQSLGIDSASLPAQKINFLRAADPLSPRPPERVPSKSPLPVQDAVSTPPESILEQ